MLIFTGNWLAIVGTYPNARANQANKGKTANLDDHLEQPEGRRQVQSPTLVNDDSAS